MSHDDDKYNLNPLMFSSSSKLDKESGNPSPQPPKNKKSPFGFMSGFFTLCIILLIIFGGLVMGANYYISDLPDPARLGDPRENVSIRILSADNHNIAIRGAYFAGEVALEDISDSMKHAVLAIEDRNFYHHFGYDPVGIIRAFMSNLFAGRVVQGASTLTQQLAKDLFLSSERSYSRKIKELLYAVKIEGSYSKDRIFELYLNRAYLGGGLYGIKAASERYFNKHPKDLTLSESALLAGLLKAPSRYSPASSPVKARERAIVVLRAMVDAGYITAEERDNAIKNPAPLRLTSLGNGFGYIADRVADIVPRLIGTLEQDVIVTTTINTDLQEVSDSVIYDYVHTTGAKNNFTQSAFIAMKDDGAIIAMTGGKSYSESPFNRTSQAYRQPGSAFKPFVYAAAMERGHTPDDIMIDDDTSFGKYRPTNYDGKYEGAMTLQSAFAKSVNVIAVKLAHEMGIEAIRDTAKKAGIVSEMKPYLSLALGAFEVTPLELTAAYIPFFNDGILAPPYLVSKIKTLDGITLYERKAPPERAIFSYNTVGSMKQLFAATTGYGTGRSALLPNIPTYGKTGTTSGYKDAWFIGHAGNKDGITAGVWVGNDNYAPTKKATGGGFAAPLWKNIMTSFFQISPRPFEASPSLAPHVNNVPSAPPVASPDVIQNILQELQKEAPPSPSEVQPIAPVESSHPTPTSEVQPIAPIPPLAPEPPAVEIPESSPTLPPAPMENTPPPENKNYDDKRIESLLRKFTQ